MASDCQEFPPTPGSKTETKKWKMIIFTPSLSISLDQIPFISQINEKNVPYELCVKI